MPSKVYFISSCLPCLCVSRSFHVWAFITQWRYEYHMCKGQRRIPSIGHHPISFLKNISIYLLFVSLFNDRYDSHLDSELPGLFYLCIPPRSILDSWECINCFTTLAFMLSLRIQTGPPVCIASTSTNWTIFLDRPSSFMLGSLKP